MADGPAEVEVGVEVGFATSLLECVLRFEGPGGFRDKTGMSFDLAEPGRYRVRCSLQPGSLPPGSCAGQADVRATCDAGQRVLDRRAFRFTVAGGGEDLRGPDAELDGGVHWTARWDLERDAAPTEA